MQRLSQYHVLIAGVGAVGAAAAEFFARAGIGKLTLVDFDPAEITDLNRHVATLRSGLGRPKTQLVAERLRAIRPDMEVTEIPLFIDEQSIPHLFAMNPDAIIDAIDSLNPKVSLLAAAHRQPCYLVSAMGAGGRTDPSRVRRADISETHTCGLARLVRKRLRRHGVYSGIPVIFSDEPALAVGERERFDRGRSRHRVGTISYMPAVFGAFLAEAVIRHLREGCPKEEPANHDPTQRV